jgi:hypothetical protein
VESDRNKTLQQLDGQDWGKPTIASHLVAEWHRLRKVPMRDFKDENLRILIGQNIGLEYLVPLAIERLEANPFAEGDFYPGDLLVSVLRAEPSFWQKHSALRNQIAAITERAIELFPTAPQIASKTVTRAVRSAFVEFQQRQASDV